MGHALAGCGLAAGRIDTQHDGFHRFVLRSLAQGFDDVVAVDAHVHAAGAAVHDVAFGIDDGYLVLRLLVGGGQVEVLGVVLQEEELLAVVVAFKLLAHIFFEAQGVDKTVLLGIVGQVSAQVVGNGVELGHVDVAAGGNGVGGGVPNA